jgi:hypothetical protein
MKEDIDTRVLIADDEQVMRDFLGGIFSEKGYQIDFANDAGETIYDSDRADRECEKSGTFAYLPKPFLVSRIMEFFYKIKKGQV